MSKEAIHVINEEDGRTQVNKVKKLVGWHQKSWGRVDSLKGVWKIC